MTMALQYENDPLGKIIIIDISEIPSNQRQPLYLPVFTKDYF